MKTYLMNGMYRSLVQFTNAHFPVLLAKLRFRKLFGRNLNLKNPQDLNEKILWLSLFSDTSEWSRLADKYAVRQYVEEKGLGHILLKLYGKWDKVEDIDWDSLPKSFVLKTNNGSGTVLIVKDKNKIDIGETKLLLNEWLIKRPSCDTTEFHYNKIIPCIIAEELLVQPNKETYISETLIDYKIWCFNGKSYIIRTYGNRVEGSTEIATFDKEWNDHPEVSVFNDHYRACKILPSRPKRLQEMLLIAETLSEGFPEVRVDLYYVNDKIYFGELTFTSQGACMNNFTPEFLFEMGKHVDLRGIKKEKRYRK